KNPAGVLAAKLGAQRSPECANKIPWRVPSLPPIVVDQPVPILLDRSLKDRRREAADEVWIGSAKKGGDKGALLLSSPMQSRRAAGAGCAGGERIEGYPKVRPQ